MHRENGRIGAKKSVHGFWKLRNGALKIKKYSQVSIHLGWRERSGTKFCTADGHLSGLVEAKDE